MAPTAIRRDLKRFRMQSGLTQADLAKRLKITQPHYSRIESGKTPAGNGLFLKIRRLLKTGSTDSAVRDEWLEKVHAAATQSQQFRELVTAAMALMKAK